MSFRQPQHIRQLAAIALLTLGSSVSGQHVDILVWDEGGRVGIGEYDYDNAVANERRVHVSRFDSFYSVNDPGVTAFSGPDALPGNADLLWDYLPMTVDAGPHEGHASTILFWDGQSDTPEFGPTPTEAYEFSTFGLDGPAVATGADHVEPGGVFERTSPNGAIHEHRFFYLDDNGDGMNTTLPEAGIYLIGMQFSIGDLTPSDPVYIVWATPEASVLPAIQPAARWVNDRVDTLFVDPIDVGIDGDFNGDGRVDAADYTVWRDGLGSVYQASDYEVWAANYGSVAPAAGSAIPVPAPNCVALLAALASGASVYRNQVSFFGA